MHCTPPIAMWCTLFHLLWVGVQVTQRKGYRRTGFGYAAFVALEHVYTIYPINGKWYEGGKNQAVFVSLIQKLLRWKFGFLNTWAVLVGIRAKNTAVPFFRFQRCTATGACVICNSIIVWHFLLADVTAKRTSEICLIVDFHLFSFCNN